ncbi:ABC transporter ATP-binding protein [Arenicella xantha]|uniref:ABC-2 type transport system ATP-binding protein n=1 Tax=Arenicella xantha TaxID=644221 RepID=A0A395JIC0_9GAMM|nr:ABC transporter ATP-binding protein [Arenicella xantha]RBP49613.1 ABC-2 type transport system ATP-binding protein [Arenicella xantha]
MLEPIHGSPIIIDRLTKTFGTTRALDEISLSFPNGGITALLGSNGAGKTSLINCALGLEQPSSGSITVLGGKAGKIDIKRRIGVMLQDSDLPDQLTAREHISLFSTYYEKPHDINALLTLCELDGFADTRYKKLSGGQKRRVQFALAIVGRPQLVFLDEPTTGLDIDARRVLWNTIRDLREQGTSVVLTTHYLEEADTLADHIIVMNAGKIIANAASADIRAAVSGAVIRCQTSLNENHLAALTGVQTVQTSGRFIEILTNSGTQTLRELLSLDDLVTELTVTKPTLENAFKRLTSNG